MASGKKPQITKANIPRTLAKTVFPLSFPNPGGEAVSGLALAFPRRRANIARKVGCRGEGSEIS
jgi:hypothetical protein